ncbi:MAG TPA: hypothetical protein VE547_14355 [Mycobacteriales bacterium]|jgi:hypothetical protein|nr:hypothetical protein [Mycobacteriales bacterium]
MQLGNVAAVPVVAVLAAVWRRLRWPATSWSRCRDLAVAGTAAYLVAATHLQHRLVL